MHTTSSWQVSPAAPQPGSGSSHPTDPDRLWSPAHSPAQSPAPAPAQPTTPAARHQPPAAPDHASHDRPTVNRQEWNQ